MNELTPTAQMIEMSKQVTFSLEKIEAIESQTMQNTIDIQTIKDNSYLHPSINNMITKKRRARVIQCMGGKDSKAYKHTTVDEEGKRHRFSSEVFSEMERDFKENFDIMSYSELPKMKKDSAIKYISEWEPSTNTKLKIKELNNQVELFAMA